jgi:hypothetical protein
MSNTFPAVEPHIGIEPISDDVWVVSGSVVMAPLVRLTRNMVILRQGTELTLVNSVRLDDAGLAALDALGKVAHVIKIGMHGMDDAFYVDRYGAKMWALDGAALSNGVEASDVLSADAELPVDDLRLFLFEHTVKPEAALLLERDGGLLITCDSVQNWTNTDRCSAMAKVVTSAMGFLKPAQIGPPWRKKMTPKGGSLRPDFERLAALPFQHLVAGHGTVLRDHAQTKLQETIVRVYG